MKNSNPILVYFGTFVGVNKIIKKVIHNVLQIIMFKPKVKVNRHFNDSN